MMCKLVHFLLGGALLATAVAVSAEPLVLTFEGLESSSPVGNYYAAQGVTFSPSTLALIDSDAGGSGNFANAPSGITILFFTDASNAVLNYANGFSSGFSFFYTSSTVATVNIYDGLNATGSLLASLNLTAQYADDCVGDPTGSFCNWTGAGTSFTGVARSIDFGGTANQIGFDNITLGANLASGAVPEPASWVLMIAGFGLVGAASRRRSLLASA